jgi:DNA excision repair protein ERCC-1
MLALGPSDSLSDGLSPSLKYHRLHPEYIYTRIRNLQGKYQLRILLTMVDIPNHEDSLRELAKTSLVNQVTVMLCWSAAEAARYLELYKSYEHAGFTAIRGQQASSYAERLVEFVTVPRTVNKADAVALVSTFGSLRNAINASPDQIANIGGWGEKKVKSWCRATEEPFRIKKKARRKAGTTTGAATRAGENTLGQPGVVAGSSRSQRTVLDDAIPIGRVPARDMSTSTDGEPSRDKQNESRRQNFDAEEEAMLAAAIEESKRTAQQEKARQDEHLSEGVAAALARLRDKG